MKKALIVTLLLLGVLAPTSASAAVGNVTIGTASYPVEGYNTDRAADQMIIYRAPLTVSPANEWGVELVVVNGQVTALRDQQTTGVNPMTVPAGGVVVSGHGAARRWLLANASVGAVISLPGTAPPPSPTGSVAAINGSSYVIAGTNVDRVADALVIYTSVSTANQWGLEAAVNSSNVITSLSDRQNTGAGPVTAPSGGYVLSGHGAARRWLLANAQVGRTVTLPSAPSDCRTGYVRLTFDDGPRSGPTDSILATLRARNIKATFFVIGEDVQRAPTLLQQTKTDGHKIGNHTWTHPYLTQQTDAEMALEFSQTSDLIQSLTGARPTEWRPPYEDYNTRVRNNAIAAGLSTMTLWDYPTDSWDWKGLTAQQITDRLLANVFPGATFLMHDRSPNMAAALPGLLDALTTRGYCYR